MTRLDALEVIRQALGKATKSDVSGIDENTSLVEDGVIDSLDSMTFLFELEKALGKRIAEIDDSYSDFRVSSLIDIVEKY